MLQWWSRPTVLEQVFWWIAFSATAIFLCQMCLTFLGVDSHHDLSVQDTTFDTPDDTAGFKPCYPNGGCGGCSGDRQRKKLRIVGLFG